MDDSMMVVEACFQPCPQAKRQVDHAGCRHGSCECACLCSCACDCIQKPTPQCSCVPIEARLGSFIAGRLGAQPPANLDRILGLNCSLAQGPAQPSSQAMLFQGVSPSAAVVVPTPTGFGCFNQKRDSEEIKPSWALAPLFDAPRKKRAVSGFGSDGCDVPMAVAVDQSIFAFQGGA